MISQRLNGQMLLKVTLSVAACLVLWPRLITAQEQVVITTTSWTGAKPVQGWIWAEREPSSPQAAVESDRVIFLDSRGRPFQEAKRLKNSDIAWSREGSCVALFDIEQNTIKKPRRIAVFAVYKITGELLYTIQCPTDHDEPYPAIFLSDAGHSVVAWAAQGRLDFYDASGGLLESINVFQDTPYCYERPIYVAVSGDAKYLAVATQRTPAVPQTGHRTESTILLFTILGEELWRRPLGGSSCAHVAMSGDGARAIASSYTWSASDSLVKMSEVFDHQGGRQAAFPLLARHALFDTDGRRLLLAEKRRAELVDVFTRSTIYTWKTNRDGRSFIADVAGTENLDQVLILAAKSEFNEDHFAYVDLCLHKLSEYGQVQWEKTFPSAVAQGPSLAASKDLKTVVVGFEDRYIRIEEQSETHR